MPHVFTDTVDEIYYSSVVTFVFIIKIRQLFCRWL